jgi:glycosyltransferase involved in cell wall biosynthesis
VLFSGVLEPRKRVDALIDAAAIAKARGIEFEMAIVGDGSQRRRLEEQSAKLGLDREIRFIGSMSFDQAMTWYSWANCLVLPSKGSEGWPKVVAEGMCHGLVCVAVRHGHVPSMLDGRGLLLETGSPTEIADALEYVSRCPEEIAELRQRAAAWARRFSLEGLYQSLAGLLEERWDARSPLGDSGTPVGARWSEPHVPSAR